MSTVTDTYYYINQLLSEDRVSYSCDYTYDANGNRLTRTLGSTTEDYICDSGDKLTEIKIGSTTIKSFSYDAAGRTTGITYSGSTTTLAYDYESRVTSITRSGVTTNTNSYNGLDTRYSTTDSAGTKTFKRAGAGVLAPVLGDGSAVYTPGISERRSSTTTYCHPGIKSGEAQSSTSQVIGATRQYDAFGNLDSSTGTWKGPFGYGGSFGYQETGDHGLRLLGHRYYDPSVGRFLTRDPIRDGRNWYGYCGNNPIAHSDSSGLNPIDDWGKAWDNYLNGLANQFGNWVGGRQTQDPNGNHVQIGGQFNWNIFNPPGNALTMDGVIHFTDENTYADYLLDPHWQNHEEGHIAQNMTWWKLPSYGFCAFVGAELESKYHLPPSQGGPLGHNYNFWEWDAERYAVQKEGQ